MTLLWYPERLNAAITEAYLRSLELAREDAAAHAPSVAGAELHGTALVGTGLAPVFEHGRRGGYEIAPKKALALRFPSGSFASFAKGGAMKPEPFLGPAAARWATSGFQATARVTLATQGF